MSANETRVRAIECLGGPHDGMVFNFHTDFPVPMIELFWVDGEIVEVHVYRLREIKPGRFVWRWHSMRGDGNGRKPDPKVSGAGGHD